MRDFRKNFRRRSGMNAKRGKENCKIYEKEPRGICSMKPKKNYRLESGCCGSLAGF